MIIEVKGGLNNSSFAVEGRSTLGLAPLQNLAVDAKFDLAIDDADDLAVFVGVMWSGRDATTRIMVEGFPTVEVGSPS